MGSSWRRHVRKTSQDARQKGDLADTQAKLMDAEAKHREASFKDVSLKDQLDLLGRTAGRHFEGLGFEITTVDHNQPSDASIWTLDGWAREYFSGAMLGVKRDRSNLRMVFFHPIKSVNKRS